MQKGKRTGTFISNYYIAKGDATDKDLSAAYKIATPGSKNKSLPSSKSISRKRKVQKEKNDIAAENEFLREELLKYRN